MLLRLAYLLYTQVRNLACGFLGFDGLNEAQSLADRVGIVGDSLGALSCNSVMSGMLHRSQVRRLISPVTGLNCDNLTIKKPGSKARLY